MSPAVSRPTRSDWKPPLFSVAALLALGAATFAGRPQGGDAANRAATQPASDRAIAAAPKATPPAYDQALDLYRAGRTTEALAVIERAVAAFGTTPALHALAGWCHLRQGALESAESSFQAALVLDPRAIDPQVGMGYVLIRRGEPRPAAERFAIALRRDPENFDALKGLGLARRDQKRHAEAADLFRRVLAGAPGDAEAQALLDQALAASGSVRETRPRPAVDPETPITVVARAGAGRLEIAAGGSGRFQALFVKGVNMGVALPGRFPAEFPGDAATYHEWLEAVSDMGANAVRLYTLLPPAFYQALARHNRERPQRRLWLIQGVWTELPPDDDYDGEAFLRGFQDEIRRVIDALHGNLDLPVRPGHASGAYRADVSASLLAWLLGREWEPFSVKAYDARAPRPAGAAPAGEFFGADPARGATPFEGWLARIMDFTARYETAGYRQQRPISFVNWPTLDPLSHPTESTVEEEKKLLQARGEAVAAARIVEYDNDGVSVDAAHIRPTAKARGGGYATYHAYPYYPDFISLDPGYSAARDSRGRSNYIGYLRDLARHHGDQPVLIAEFGVPSSRGIAHMQPQGWNHGGHSEREQGEIDARLMLDIREAGLAGGVLFSLLDEWFKRNWLVLDFEVPYERNPLWLNVLDPEQNYGLLAARPGARGPVIRIDGRDDDWRGIEPLGVNPEEGPERPAKDRHDPARTLRSIAVTSDEAYVYVRLGVDALDGEGDGRPDWDEAAYLIGIDTYDAARGDHRMPLAETVASPAGLEFCLVFDGEKTARLLIDPPYDIQTHRYSRPYGSVRNDDGRFMEMWVETNRPRIGRDGTPFPAQGYSRSSLRHASADLSDPDGTTLADWKTGVDASFIEARIAWGLLNVTDPSSRRVLHDNPHDLRTVGTVVTEGFRFYAMAVKPRGRPGGATPLDARWVDRLPRGGGVRASDLPAYRWSGWDRPSWRLEKKEAWGILKQAFEAMPSSPGERP